MCLRVLFFLQNHQHFKWCIVHFFAIDIDILRVIIEHYDSFNAFIVLSNNLFNIKFIKKATTITITNRTGSGHFEIEIQSITIGILPTCTRKKCEEQRIYNFI